MINEFIETMLACATLEDVGRAHGKALAREGFSASAGRAFVPGHGQQEHNFFLNWPAAWKRISAERNFARKSAIVTEARRRFAPFTWSQLKSERTFTPVENEAWTAAAEWGWTDGFTVPIHGPRGSFSVMGMAATEKGLDLSPAGRMRLSMMAVIVHERCCALGKLAPARDMRAILSGREVECLRWVADGRTDVEIAVILGISAATVRFHVDNVRIKLGVRNRSQAVAQFALAGML
ncbi:LuxR family transcriptional regulator [Bosea sp. 685]|uniref:LuxR family transcriptional regulator n=1 Tax=Bosea sp. 685 TaxID=3080057 RepID=UPI002892F98D|nr:LuxR family transcriptional regulator [Bosea sp. 685]WNJ93545.1 LuxR family transcriptional regulator [Bosea sp. 685]